MNVINTTLSFRAAWRYGVPHLAGQPVFLTPRDRLGLSYDVACRGERLGVAYNVQSMREHGGVPRTAETLMPRRKPTLRETIRNASWQREVAEMQRDA